MEAIISGMTIDIISVILTVLYPYYLVIIRCLITISYCPTTKAASFIEISQILDTRLSVS
jgi:hypothetical protein